MTSTNLKMTDIPSLTDTPEVQANENDDQVDKATQGHQTRQVSGDFTMTQAECRDGFVLVLQDNTDLNGAFNCDFPAAAQIAARTMTVVNLTGQTCTVRANGGGGHTLAVSDGNAQHLHYDGSNVRALAAAIAWPE